MLDDVNMSLGSGEEFQARNKCTDNMQTFWGFANDKLIKRPFRQFMPQVKWCRQRHKVFAG